jgi:hypothetical protein
MALPFHALIATMQKQLFRLALAMMAGTLMGQAAPPPNYSGTYSFLREGEFVQITVEDVGKVTGFISRYGDADNEKDAFLDHFFKAGKLNGSNLTFSTQTVHGVWFDFKGAFERGDGKTPGEEAYYLLKGTLTRNSTDANQKTSSTAIEVSFKSFPESMDAPRQKPD